MPDDTYAAALARKDAEYIAIGQALRDGRFDDAARLMHQRDHPGCAGCTTVAQYKEQAWAFGPILREFDL